MIICIYANCQGDGIAHYMKRARPDLYIRVHHNWQIILGETRSEDLMADAAVCDVFVYQPTQSLKHGMLSTEEMVRDVVPQSALKLSFPYVFNTGFFPIVKHGRWWTGNQVFEAARKGECLRKFDRNEFHYDCMARFEENLLEQEERERQCHLKFAPFIREHFRTKHLFLLCNHPASAMLAEMARRVLDEMGITWQPVIQGPNDAGLPGYHAVHPAVVQEMGLTFQPDRRGEDPLFYRTLMIELDKELKGQT